MQAERQRRWYQNLTPEQREARRSRQRKGFDHSQSMSSEARRARAVKARAAHRPECSCGPCLTANGKIDFATLREWGYLGGTARHRKWIRSHSSRSPEGRAWQEERLEEMGAEIRQLEEEIRAEKQVEEEQRGLEQALPKQNCQSPYPLKTDTSQPCGNCHERPGKPDVNFCTSCGKDFGGVVAFDEHRVGRHQYDYSPNHPDGRRCLSTHEMVKKQFRLNTRGAWSRSTFKGV
jgi:hypothetical protein